LERRRVKGKTTRGSILLLSQLPTSTVMERGKVSLDKKKLDDQNGGHGSLQTPRNPAKEVGTWTQY